MDSMSTRPPMAIGEWYHCYTRGVDKRKVFESQEDYDRFLVHLYVANGTRNIRVSDMRDTRLKRVLEDESLDRGHPIVEIGAYSLMPTHVHFLLREIRDGGIALFMQKTFTGYTMYFNNKNERTGALFSGTFKSKHVNEDRYLKQVIPYILLNPVELFYPDWKNGIGDIDSVEKKLLAYPYSSLQEFQSVSIERPHKKIVNGSFEMYYEQLPTLSQMLCDAHEYYRERRPQV